MIGFNNLNKLAYAKNRTGIVKSGDFKYVVFSRCQLHRVREAKSAADTPEMRVFKKNQRATLIF